MEGSEITRVSKVERLAKSGALFNNTVTIAAPVKINGKKGIVGVVVKKTKGNRYKTHRIVMPDGTVFAFEKNKTEATTASMTNRKTGEGPAITPVLDNSISAEGTKNNTKYSLVERPAKSGALFNIKLQKNTGNGINL